MGNTKVRLTDHSIGEVKDRDARARAGNTVTGFPKPFSSRDEPNSRA